MQQVEHVVNPALAGAGRRRVEAVVETLATLGGRGESLSEVAHDARNMVTALGLYCELLEEPGVLAPPFVHYGSELRLVAAASRRLVEKLVMLDSHAVPAAALPPLDRIGAARNSRLSDQHVRDLEGDVSTKVMSLAGELMATRNLLAALAGPAISVAVDVESAALPVHMTSEELTRILVNLVKNAAEAMPSGGRIQIALQELPAFTGTAQSLQLCIEDNGPGIPADALDRVFESGYTTRASDGAAAGTSRGGWPAIHRGLGLSITRSIVEASGGSIRASNRSPGGARFEIVLPVML